MTVSDAQQTAPSRLIAWLTSPYLFMSLAMLCWSGNWLLGRAMHTSIGPITLNLLRWGGAALVLLPFTARGLWAARAEIVARWRILLVLGVLGSALYQGLVYMALNYTTAINAALFNTTAPMVVVGLSWLITRERITRRQGLGIALSLVGVLIIVTRGDLAVLLKIHFNPGDLLALASVPVWGLYTVLLQRRPTGMSPLVFLTCLSLVGTAALSPFFVWEYQVRGAPEWGVGTIVTVIYVALVASVIAYILWNNAVPRVGANKAGPFLHLHPVFTTVLAMLFLGEVLHLYHVAGMALIALGIWLTATGGRRE
jgi:drug/metabolite transporter (DMT)-like permease